MPSPARIAGITVAGLASLWLGARFLMWEPDGLERGSMLYELKIPADAKAWPLWEPSGAVLYDFRHADGGAHGYTRIRYAAAQSEAALRASLERQGYVCTEPSPRSIVCDLQHGAVTAAQVIAERDQIGEGSNVAVYVFVD